MVNICIPVLNNYKGLKEEINSIEAGTVKPDMYYIFDNGRNFNRELNLFPWPVNTKVIQPDNQVSLAAAWNWFIKNVSETRIIINDDLLFYENTLEVFVNGMDNSTISFPYGVNKMNAFSFFSIPDKVVEQVGLFEEAFYPAYFDDNDYDFRLHLNNLYVYGISDCNVIHAGSQTLKNFTAEQTRVHHSNFEKNKALYVKMWGGMPGNETYKTKYNR